MTRAFNIEGLVRLQNYMGGKTFSCILGSSQQQMVVTKATKQLDVTTTEIGGGGITPGSITTEMLADGAVTTSKIGPSAVGQSKLASNSVTSLSIATGAVTSEKLAAGLDVSGLFFILPEGTQFPYTLSDDEYEKLSKASFMMLYSSTNAYFVLSPAGLTNRPTGSWWGSYSNGSFVRVTISGKEVGIPGIVTISDNSAVKFTSQTLSADQKTQAIRKLRWKIRIRPAIRKLRWRSRPLSTRNLYRNTLCHL